MVHCWFDKIGQHSELLTHNPPGGTVRPRYHDYRQIWEVSAKSAQKIDTGLIGKVQVEYEQVWNIFGYYL